MSGISICFPALRLSGVVGLAGVLVSGAAADQETKDPRTEQTPASEQERGGEKFRLRFVVKAGARGSKRAELPTRFPFPPEMVPRGETAVFLRTVDEGTSLEVSSVSLRADGQLTPQVSARVDAHLIDLYDRNPTSSDELVALREAWVRFGIKQEALAGIPGTTLYGQLGKFPRFTRRANRRLESYGLWGTAVGRFEEIGVELGVSFGEHVYWRGSLTGGNAVFLRDPNALAGDNGAPERLNIPPNPVFQSGFPILYDAKAQDVTLDGRFMVGGGLGLRWLAQNEQSGVDLLAWYFAREMEDRARIRGTFYEGDLEILRGAGIPLPFRGRDKSEWGVNLEGRWRRLQASGQYVAQEIAELKRDGFELELACRIQLGGVFVSGDEPVLNWIEPVVRYSRIDHQFALPAEFVAPSLGLDRRKLDVGVRLGIVRGLDLTLEYAFHELITGEEAVRPNEALVTLRVAY